MREKQGVRVLDRALSVLNFMAEERRPVGITEIAEATGLSKATVHRILATLQLHGVVLKDRESKYQIGPAVLLWAESHRRASSLLEISRPHLESLWELSKETVHLFVYENGAAYYLEKLESPHPVGMRSRIGARLSLYSTSAGKAILAALPENELCRYLSEAALEPKTSHTKSNPEELRKELEMIRQRGYAEDNQENEEGIRCVGAAILDFRGYPVGAVSISAPAYRFSGAKSSRLGEKVREAALLISRELGYKR